MLQQIIIAIHLMVVTALVILVLYQKSEGGALGMGGSGVFTGRGQANALTRATGILATIFFLTSIALTVLPAWERRAAGGDDWTKAIDQGDVKVKEMKPGEKPDPAKDSVFDQLQRAAQKRQQGATGAAPAEDKPALRPTQEPPKAEAPAAEAPKVEAPKVEAPKVEAPKPEAPKVEAPKVEAPKAEAPKAEQPKWESPKSEPAKPEAAPAAEAPKAQAVPPAEAPKAEAPKAEPPKAETPKAETPVAPAPQAPTQWKSPVQ